MARDTIDLTLTKLPLSMRWEFSPIRAIANKAANIAAFLLFAAACLYLMSDAANAGIHASDKATIRKQQDDIAALTKIVAACLSDATGKPIRIGNEMYLCGIVPVGRFP